jgi:DNA-directed RNA polymerase subunit RPC12/RpoP
MAVVDTVCPECGSNNVTGELGATTAKVECGDCGHRATVRYEGNG